MSKLQKYNDIIQSDVMYDPWLYSIIIPTPHHYAYFEQFDWLEKKFYTSLNSMSRNLWTIFLSPTPNMFHDVNKNNISMTNLEL